MSPLEDRYRDVLTHFKAAYRGMPPLTDLTGDWAAAAEVRREFQHPRRKVREFARCQHGLGLPPAEERG
jgi:hypothetical protein